MHRPHSLAPSTCLSAAWQHSPAQEVKRRRAHEARSRGEVGEPHGQHVNLARPSAQGQRRLRGRVQEGREK